MASSWRRQRVDDDRCMPDDALASPPEAEWTLPADLLLEIVARSDTRTLLRSAATSKLLRRDVLDPAFIRRITREEEEGGAAIVPGGCVVARLNAHDDEADPPPPLSLVHPATSSAAAATSFVDDHMCRYMSRMADDLLAEQVPVTSRGGLVLFRRRHASATLSAFCVHDLLTGDRTFLSCPPDMDGSDSTRNYVLLTAADGVGCSFMLFFANLHGKLTNNNTHIVQVYTATPACPAWAPAAMVHESSGFFKNLCTATNRGVAVLHGGVIHWLLRSRGEIATYNVCAMERGTITLPALILTSFKGGWCNLGSYYSHDGRKLLRLVIFKKFKIHVWHQLADHGDWELGEATIDMEETLRSIDPDIRSERIAGAQFQWCGEGSSIVLLRIHRHRPCNGRAMLVLLDLETRNMVVQQRSSTSSMLLEVDLASRLLALNLFSQQNSTSSDTY